MLSADWRSIIGLCTSLRGSTSATMKSSSIGRGLVQSKAVSNLATYLEQQINGTDEESLKERNIQEVVSCPRPTAPPPNSKDWVSPPTVKPALVSCPLPTAPPPGHNYGELYGPYEAIMMQPILSGQLPITPPPGQQIVVGIFQQMRQIRAATAPASGFGLLSAAQTAQQIRVSSARATTPPPGFELPSAARGAQQIPVSSARATTPPPGFELPSAARGAQQIPVSSARATTPPPGFEQSSAARDAQQIPVSSARATTPPPGFELPSAARGAQQIPVSSARATTPPPGFEQSSAARDAQQIPVSSARATTPPPGFELPRAAQGAQQTGVSSARTTTPPPGFENGIAPAAAAPLPAVVNNEDAISMLLDNEPSRNWASTREEESRIRCLAWLVACFPRSPSRKREPLLVLPGVSTEPPAKLGRLSEFRDTNNMVISLFGFDMEKLIKKELRNPLRKCGGFLKRRNNTNNSGAGSSSS
ncbi:unnamed protein product [Caenorhabditis sp. 36 PRJEB53466]|nr:unnamed protein product [Caenorhabditis sp. 36 PRJEB53466]